MFWSWKPFDENCFLLLCVDRVPRIGFSLRTEKLSTPMVSKMLTSTLKRVLSSEWDLRHHCFLNASWVTCFFRQVGNNLIVPGGARLIDAKGKFVIPGSYHHLSSILFTFERGIFCCGMLLCSSFVGVCFPGGIDTHTHLQLPFMGTTTADDFYTGTVMDYQKLKSNWKL